MIYELPTSLNVNGTDYEIRSDYRNVLDVIIALNDADLSDHDRAEVLLTILYPAFLGYEEDGSEIVMKQEDYEEAIAAGLRFINGGEKDDGVKRKKQMDWEQDFELIVSPVNRIAGYEVRSVPYLHWYTFLSYFKEIGDCLFSQVVGIRDKLSSGKKLDKADREFYKRNKNLVDFKNKYCDTDKDLLKTWGAG